MGSQDENEDALDIQDHSRPDGFEKREMESDRTFFVRAPSVHGPAGPRSGPRGCPRRGPP